MMTARRLLAVTIVASALAGAVVTSFLLVVLLLGREPTHGERTVLLLAALAATTVALVWPAVRRRAERVARRIAWGGRPAPDDLVHSFSTRLTRAVPLEELLLQLAESLRDVLGLVAAEVWTGSDGLLVRTASDPDRGPARVELSAEEEGVVVRAGASGAAWAAVWLGPLVESRHEALLRLVPVAHGGALLGLLAAEREPGGRPFTADEDRVLVELARQVGVVLHSARLDSALASTLDELRRQAEELRLSRIRMVAAADAARRRIERDLHDGAQQRLVALAMQLRAAIDLLVGGDAAARAALIEVERGLETSIEELRDLAHGIYPPLLAERGLRDALTAAARKAPVPTRVEAVGLGRYVSGIEEAVYFCVLEAIQNASKHGGSETRVSVSLREQERSLVFEVSDDGCGFDPLATRRGMGVTNMADRVGAVGGRLRVESAAGRGTTVTGRIPVYAEASAR